MEQREWPAFVAARSRLGFGAIAELNQQLFSWVVGLVFAEREGTLERYPGAGTRPEWIELSQFRVLIRARVDREGRVTGFDLFDLRAR
jgi:hypothetical protein